MQYQQEVEPTRETLALIGEVTVTWGAIEKHIYGCIGLIESAAAVDNWPPTRTDVQAMRDFKQRKGFLRKLVEQYGTKEELAALDVLYQRLVTPSKVRHSMAHDIVVVHMDGSLAVLSPGNMVRGKLPEGKIKKPDYLRDAIQEMRWVIPDLARITGNISMRLARSKTRT